MGLLLPLLLLLVSAALSRWASSDKAVWLPLLLLAAYALAALLLLLSLAFVTPEHRGSSARALLAVSLPLLYAVVVVVAGRMGWIDPGNWIGVR